MNAMTNPTILTQASTQWMSRPADQRFTSLDDMLAQMKRTQDQSRARVISTRKIEARPIEGDATRKGLALVGDFGGKEVAMPTNWAFGQLAARADAPSAYLRKLPADIAADCINWGLMKRPVEEIGILAVDDLDGVPAETLAAATGPNYGRVWNTDVVDALIQRFGDGVTGNFRVPGEFGKAVEVTKANTTLYASDRDMFVFLADEEHRIEMPNRRNSLIGSLARGFFVWNSEVGAQTLGVATFLFDYTCCNRIVWGAEGYKELRVRHSSGAPDRFVEEVAPALITYANSSTRSITEALETARAEKIEKDVDEFLTSKRFSRSQAKAIVLAHEAEEGRPIETVWDAVTGATAYAKGIANQDDRVAVERLAGAMLPKAA